MMGAPLVLLAMASGTQYCPPKAPAGMVARPASFGGVIAPDAASADAAVAAGIVAQHAARRFLGLEVPPFLIASASAALPSSPDGCTFRFRWSFPAAAGEVPRLPSHVLPHEIGHAIFIRFLVPNSGKDQYGGDAPDWLDEMAAMACEDPAGAQMRRADTLRHARRGALLPMARFLSMSHPEWSARPITEPGTDDRATRQPRSSDTPAFYATTRALFDFLIDRTDDEQIVRVLADRVRAGMPLNRWLLANVAAGSGRRGLAGLDVEDHGVRADQPGLCRDARGCR